MRLRSVQAFLVLLVSLSVALPAPAPALGQEADRGQGRCLLWKVTSPTNTVYLLGSVHFGKADLYPLPAEIEKAFTESKSLVVEVNIAQLDRAKVSKLVLEKGLNPLGQKLSSQVSKETAEQLRAHCEKRNIPLAPLEPFRPWLAQLRLNELERKRLGLSDEYGLDRHFLAAAKAANKPVLELETFEGQIEVMAGQPPELQEKVLRIGLAEMGEMKERLEKMLAAWTAGDTEALVELVFRIPLQRHPETKLVHEKMIYERNTRMAERIEGYLQGKESCFVVVGALHLVGERGILKSLEDRKYRVEQVSRTPAR